MTLKWSDIFTIIAGVGMSVFGVLWNLQKTVESQQPVILHRLKTAEKHIEIITNDVKQIQIQLGFFGKK